MNAEEKIDEKIYFRLTDQECNNYSTFPLNVTLYISNAVILVILSIILTLIGGLIPSNKASKKDPVIALRTE